MGNKPAAPKGLCNNARKLWDDVLDAYDLDGPELTSLRQAVTTLTLIEELEGIADEEGYVVEGQKGNPAIHPALAEARSQKSIYVRLLKSIGVETDGRVANRNQPKRGPGGRIRTARPPRNLRSVQ